MDQLELRLYTREEIAAALSVRLINNGNFKRDVENKLSKWGYGYNYIDRRGVEIISKPETPAERLSEILYRGFQINIQICPEQFACFIAAFTDIKGFDSMPWEERAKVYNEEYGICVSDKTLRNWCSQLIDHGVVAKAGEKTKWRTSFYNGSKIREPIEESDEIERQSYIKRFNEIFKECYNSCVKSGKSPPEARNAAWKSAKSKLWSEFNCCYYSCKCFTLSAFSDNGIDVREIYELSRELAPAASANTEPSVQAPQSEEFIF